MTPTELKAEAFERIERIVKGLKGDHLCLAAIVRIDGVIDKLRRDEKRFWRRMAKFDADVMSGKNRMVQMTRYVSPPIYLDGTKPGPEEKGHTEIWNPDKQAWERPLPKTAAE